MGTINQRQAVYAALKTVCEEKGIEFVDGTSIANDLSKDIRSLVIGIVTEGLMNGTVSLKDTDGNSEKRTDEAKMKEYTNGLVSNWFRKDGRLNGGTKYETKNPGSRAGSGDESIREMRKLLKALTESGDVDNAAVVQAEIDSRLAEIRKSRAKDTNINVDLLPETLKNMLK